MLTTVSAGLYGNPPGSLENLVTSAVRQWDHLSDDKRQRLRKFAGKWSIVTNWVQGKCPGRESPGFHDDVEKTTKFPESRRYFPCEH